MTERFDDIDRELELLGEATQVTELRARISVASRPPLPDIDDELRALGHGIPPEPESDLTPVALTPSGRPILSEDDLFSDEDFVDAPAGDIPLIDEKTFVEGKDVEPPNVPSVLDADAPIANGFFDTDSEWGRDPTSIFTEEELVAIREGSMVPPPLPRLDAADADAEMLEALEPTEDFDLLVDERSIGDEAQPPLHADLDKPSPSNPPTGKKSLLKKLFG